MKKELTMEMRLLLAFLLMGLVLFVTPYFYKQPPPQPAPKAETKAPPAAKAEPEKPSPPVAAPAAAAPAAEVPGQIQASSEEDFAIDTDLYHVEFSNRGATVRHWVLKAYKDPRGRSVELVNPLAAAKVPAPFSVAFKGQAPAPDPNAGLYQVERPDPLTVNFEYSDGRTDVKKSFRFSQNSYLVAVRSEVSQNGTPVPHELSWRGGFGDAAVANAAGSQHALFYDISNSKLNVKQVKEAKDGPVSSAGQFSFAGLEDAYFAGVFLPEGHSQVELTEFADSVPDPAGKEEQRVGAAVGGEGINTFSFFAGPKDYDLLDKVNPKLKQLIDWGWFEFLAKPLFLGLNWTADKLTHNYGWAIILVTVVINMVLFPLKITSMKSSKKMQAIQPLVNAINEKYKSIPMRDPRQAEKNEELMGLYKKHGINPLGGCLPMLLQLPFFFAFYKVLSVSIEMRGAGFLWVHDLSQPETLAIRILPIVLVITQFLSQKMTPPSPGMDPTQQKMMMFMPLMFGYIFYFLAAGLVLYYLTSNLVGIAQQWTLNRLTPAPAPILPPPKKKNRN